MQKNQNIKNILLVIVLAFLYVGCSTKNSVFSIDNRTLTLGKDLESTVSINFTNPQVQRNSAMCVFDSYNLFDRSDEYGNIFIESIQLNSSCDWTGLPLGFFESSVKNTLNVSMNLIEDIDFPGYNFRTYKVNNDSYLNIIYIFTNGNDRFILDFYGRLHDKLIKTFNKEYTNKYFAKKRFNAYYNESLVRKSLINHYFQRDRIEFIPRIGISISL